MKFKKYIPIICIGLILVVGAVMLDNHGLVPKAMAEGTQTTVTQVKSESNDVYKEIQTNIDMVTALKTKIQNLQSSGQPLPLDQVIADITKVTESYEKLANQRDSIAQKLLGKIGKVQDMENRVDSEIATLNKRKADYQSQIQSIARDPNPEIVRTRTEALTKAMTYVDDQVQLWRNFNAIEANINGQMTGIQKQLDSFLSVIQSSAILFREGLNLLQLQQNITDALSLFTVDAPQMAALSQGMENSWGTLDYLVGALTSLTGFNTTPTTTTAK